LSANHSGGALVVQLGETTRIEMAPRATPEVVKKWRISAEKARVFGSIALQCEPCKKRAGGVGVGGSNPLVPTNFHGN